MEKSTSIKELASALAKFQGLIESVSKDAENPYFKSKYASFENIRSAIKEALTASGLSFSQFPTGEDSLTTILMHNSGEFIQGTVKMTPKDRTPQAQGSAITYMKRYALSAVLGLATEDDDDGNIATQPKKVIAKEEKGLFTKVNEMIESAKTVEQLEKIDTQAKSSKNLNEAEKSLIANRIKDKLNRIIK